MFEVKEILGPCPTQILIAIECLEKLIFPEPYSAKKLQQKMKTRPGVHGLYAYFNKQLVAYKIAYERDKNVLYSWIGGVHPDFRRKGLASRLMSQQHEYARSKGYKTVVTHTSKELFPEMVALNKKYGFCETGHKKAPDGKIRLIMSKNISD